MEDIHLPSKRKLEGDDSIVPMKRGRDGIISQPSQNGDHDMVKHSTLVAIQNSIVLIKKLFRDLHALVANLFAVGSDGYLTLFFLHLYRDIVLVWIFTRCMCFIPSYSSILCRPTMWKWPLLTGCGSLARQDISLRSSLSFGQKKKCNRFFPFMMHSNVA